MMCAYFMRSVMVCAPVLAITVLGGCMGETTPPQPQMDRNTADPFAAAVDAAFKGDLDYVTLCVQSDPRYVDGVDGSGRTLLHYAAEGDQIAVVKYLLENGASVNAEDKDGYFPFDAANQGQGSKEVKDLLAEAAAKEKGFQ